MKITKLESVSPLLLFCFLLSLAANAQAPQQFTDDLRIARPLEIQRELRAKAFYYGQCAKKYFEQGDKKRANSAWERAMSLLKDSDVTGRRQILRNWAETVADTDYVQAEKLQLQRLNLAETNPGATQQSKISAHQELAAFYKKYNHNVEAAKEELAARALQATSPAQCIAPCPPCGRG